MQQSPADTPLAKHAPEPLPEPLAQLYNPSRFPHRQGLLLILFGWLFFRRVKFEPRWSSGLKAPLEGGPLVFVVNCHSLLDYMYLCWAMPRHGVTLPVAANGMGWWHALFVHRWTWVLGQLFGLWFGRLKRPASAADLIGIAAACGQPAVIFLRPARSLLQWGGGFRDELLQRLVEQQQAGVRRIRLLPLMLVWKRHTERAHRSVLDFAFGGPEAPGKLRKMFNFFFNYRSALLRMGEPVDLDELLVQCAASGVEDAKRCTQQLRYAVLRSWSAEQKVIRGPVLKNARQIREEIARNGEVQEAIKVAAEHLGVPLEAATREVNSYLKEMAADFRLGFVEGFCVALAILWNRIYDGLHVPEADLDRLREAAKRAPLVIAPNHRSHVDYLVISYVFYTNGLIPPHIAAGLNLSFFPMGYIFRHSGAFFIRRSFRSNPLYQLAFRYYMRKLAKEGYWVEFFPEGGRSRTGKLLPPKVGMIREMVLAVLHNGCDDLLFCPTSIAYEKIVEEQAIARELAGAEKQAENVGGMIRASKVLVKKYGRLYMRFAEPVSIRRYLDERIVVLGSQAKLMEPDVFARELKRLAYRILRGINDVATITPSALVCMVVLAHPRRGISRSQLLLRVGYLVDYFHFDKGAPLSDTLEEAIAPIRPQLELPKDVAIFERPTSGSLAYGRDYYRARMLGLALERVVDKTLRAFLADESLQTQHYGDEVAYRVEGSRRLTLDYYKNNAIHLLVYEALLSTALLSARSESPIPYAKVEARARFLSSLLQQEFAYDPDKGFVHQFFETFGRFEQAGWISENADGSIALQEDADELLGFFARTIQNFVEGYWVVLGQLRELAREPAREKDWLKAVQGLAHRKAAEGELAFAEAAVSVLLKNALERYVALGLVERYEQDGKAGRKGRRARPEKWLRVPADQLHAIDAWLVQLDETRLYKSHAPEPAAAAPAVLLSKTGSG